jgi:transcriptional regulator with XRE-family HTH domain
MEFINIDRQKERELLGERIAYIRKEKGISLAELSERTGIKESSILRIEEGKFSVNYDILASLAEAMGCYISLSNK